MIRKFFFATALLACGVYSAGTTVSANDEPKGNGKSTPAELRALRAMVGEWDVSVEVWPKGKDKPSIQFAGTETNRPFGQHWIASDLVTTYQDREVRVHSIIGYDLDQKSLVGTIVDHGPYAATMKGELDADTKTIHWTTHAKTPDGKPMLQKTSVTQMTGKQRVLTMMVPGKTEGEMTEVMKIEYTKKAE
ncbi:DUF1579 domain-containing protein [Rhodopirellula sp. JC740]|uniref:DUF1579 domain-containing protein n=1 Tax=Rhodopirellula halodulae TaxID=2894198 RepID=A0ABS8NES2_9BACT|nr:DUF1579 family protein [Rhodopirellula sp. JC740]MCC9641338.1 DUF1579 domain-containing protein [Rhodopirellula sp. JC740]